MTRQGLGALLRAGRSMDFWATPSQVPGLTLTGGREDQSVSNPLLGSVLEHTHGVADLEELLADVRGALRAWPLVNGGTSGNQIAMFALAMAAGRPTVLLTANCHHSVLNAAIAFGVRVRFLPGQMLPDYGAVLPPTAEQVRTALTADSSITAVIITTPTYEGLTADVSAIARIVHEFGLPLVVDAAWGAHFGYHSDLPPTTASCGADVVVESLHKTGGAGQGCAAILHAGPYLDPDLIERSFQTLVSTSPSFPLLATMEFALQALRGDGPSLLQVPLQVAAELRHGLAQRGIPVLAHPLLGDPTKVTVGGIDGFDVQDRLHKRGVVVEMANTRSVLLLATMQLDVDAVNRALAAIDELSLAAPVAPRAVTETTVSWLTAEPAAEAHDVVRSMPTTTVLATNAVGHVAAEIVELYPPGIPVLAPGWRITAEALDRLELARASGGRIVAQDRSLHTIRVVDR